MATFLNKSARARDAKKFLEEISKSTSNVVDGILFDSLGRTSEESTSQHVPKIYIKAGDTLTVAKEFNASCILSMASPYTRGGGFLRGAMAQEEYLCARTDLYLSLQKFNNIRLPAKGGIYSPEVRVLRGADLISISVPESTLSVISCAAIKCPDTTDENRLNHKDAELTLEKMKFILRCADRFEHKIVVLGALGCGAYRNPPAHVAELWKMAIFGSRNEKRNNKVEKWANISDIVFAIKDKPSERNFQIFNSILIEPE